MVDEDFVNAFANNRRVPTKFGCPKLILKMHFLPQSRASFLLPFPVGSSLHQ